MTAEDVTIKTLLGSFAGNFEVRNLEAFRQLKRAGKTLSTRSDNWNLQEK